MRRSLQSGITQGWLLLIGLLMLSALALGAVTKVTSYLESLERSAEEKGYVRGKAEIQAQFDRFKDEVAETGMRALAAKAKREEEDRKEKERTDAEASRFKSERDALYHAYISLRDGRGKEGAGSGISIVSGLPSPAKPTARICFDRAAFDSAIHRFDAGVAGLLNEGDAAIAAINALKAKEMRSAGDRTKKPVPE